MKYLIPILICCFLFSCTEDVVYTPKPRGYPRIKFPEKGFQKFDTSFCNLSFEYPIYATIEQDKLYFDEQALDPCWFDIVIPALNGKIHCSYYSIASNKQGKTFDELKEDAFKLAGKHSIKASYIDELPVRNPQGVKGFVFQIDGAVASPFQFYLTDEKDHFLRGSLYFNTQSKPDSLAPVINFVKEDMMHLINTFDWK